MCLCECVCVSVCVSVGACTCQYVYVTFDWWVQKLQYFVLITLQTDNNKMVNYQRSIE